MKPGKGTPIGDFDGPRAPMPAEIPLVSSFLNTVFRNGHPDRPIEDWYGFVYEARNLQNVRVIKLGDRIVSNAGMWITDTTIGNASIRIGGLNLVGTDRNYRRTGLATRVLNSCVDHLLDSGCHLAMLRSSLDGWYRKEGWESAGTRRVFHLDRGNRDLVQMIESGSIRQANPGDYSRIAQLRDESRLGATRTPHIMRQMLERKNTLTLVLERNRTVDAYVHGRPNSIMEYRGSAVDVLALIRGFYDRFDMLDARTSSPAKDFTHATHHLEIQAPGFEDEVAGALERIGILAGQEYVAMWRILDLEGLLGAYRGHGINGREGPGRIEFEVDGKSSSYSRTQAVKALFGPERIDDFCRSFDPLPIWQWETDIV